MASTSEVGHAKNVANFYDLIAFVIGYGATYNPTKMSLLLRELQLLYAKANFALSGVIQSNTTYIVAVNERSIVFSGLRSLSTRLINALDATEATDEIVRDAKTLNRKIQGQPASKKQQPLPTDKPAPKRISNAQLSYDQLIQHFAALISLLEAERSYAPSEASLSVAALLVKLQELKDKNEQVSGPFADLGNARLYRNQVLYDKETGLVDVAFDVKKYVKSVYGASSPEFGLISGIKFKNQKAS